MPVSPLPLEYYQQQDTLFLGKDLLGKYLLTHFNGVITGGKIIETECYLGAHDKACHAYLLRRTKRTEIMFALGGVTYIYLCYGIHALLNIITNGIDQPHAILIRAIEPEIGVEKMLQRRKKIKVDKSLAGGPGTLTQALGLNTSHNGLLLNSPFIWIEDRGIKLDNNKILQTPRIGIDYAEEDALKPWRFVLKEKI